MAYAPVLGCSKCEKKGCMAVPYPVFRTEVYFDTDELHGDYTAVSCGLIFPIVCKDASATIYVDNETGTIAAIREPKAVKEEAPRKTDDKMTFTCNGCKNSCLTLTFPVLKKDNRLFEDDKGMTWDLSKVYSGEFVPAVCKNNGKTFYSDIRKGKTMKVRNGKRHKDRYSPKETAAQELLARCKGCDQTCSPIPYPVSVAELGSHSTEESVVSVAKCILEGDMFQLSCRKKDQSVYVQFSQD
jgi:hypothetical protein